MIIHIFLLTHRQLGLGLRVFHYSPNVFLFQMADLELYFSANGYSVITCCSPNEDHLLIYIVLSFGLRSASPNVMRPHSCFLILSVFPLSYPPLPHLCWLRWSHFPLSFALSFSFTFSLFSQYHRDLEMSLSLSASQDQAVMLALNKPPCVCVEKKKCGTACECR